MAVSDRPGVGARRSCPVLVVVLFSIVRRLRAAIMNLKEVGMRAVEEGLENLSLVSAWVLMIGAFVVFMFLVWVSNDNERPQVRSPEAIRRIQEAK